jgi:lipopolysaccharide/colanic/teichoic acid biosynthesis glycosyltransferase
MPVASVLLLVEDERIANRLTALLGAVCSIIRFGSDQGPDKWLSANPTIDLIITDNTIEPSLIKAIRSTTDYCLTPILIACRSKEAQSLKPSSMSGITDILVINEDPYSVHSKVGYYLKLNARVQSLHPTDRLSVIAQFKLPWWKRLIDMAVSFTVLLLLSPLLVVVAILIKLDSKGPVFYKSKRAGANYRVFNMYKFRTMTARADQLISAMSSHNIYATESDNSSASPEYMCSDCLAQGYMCQRVLIDHNRTICEKAYLQQGEKSAKFMKFRNDPRITRLGTFLRNSSIDELPQLVNILVGDMSLVGNRPLPLYEAEKLTSNEFARRFSGPAGLTGLWQVKKRAKGQGLMSDQERAFLDIEYANTFSFKTDVHIMWQTLFSLWQKENV